MLQGKKYMIAVKLPNKMDPSEIWMEQVYCKLKVWVKKKTFITLTGCVINGGCCP